MSTVRLRDEWGTGRVSVWPLSGPFRMVTIPEGTMAVVVSRVAMNGYVAVFVGKDVFEVWHENLTGNRSNLN